MKHELFFKRHGLFDARVPRYTSYPPANRFLPIEAPGPAAEWLSKIPENQDISFYVHIPFCRRLCWFCACRTQGTKSDAPVANYLDHLAREIDMVADRTPGSLKAGRLHIGGGTPTLLTPAQTTAFAQKFTSAFDLADDVQFSVEIDPTECDRPRLEAWVEAGMNRASLGVQDFDIKVQESIGRAQSFEQTRRTITDLRDLGVDNINLDVLYGLPHQTEATINETIDKVLALDPSRIAAFGYAHVPWMSKRQSLIPEEALPDPTTRLRLFNLLLRRLTRAGYVQIGIDHFAKPEDGLARALAERRLHRNFQGYTDDASPWLIGLGASAISRYPEGYLHNATSTSAWLGRIDHGILATARGIEMTDEEHLTAEMIERIMCYSRIDIEDLVARFGPSARAVKDRLERIAESFAPMVRFDGRFMNVEREALPLLRVIAAGLDKLPADQAAHARAV